MIELLSCRVCNYMVSILHCYQSLLDNVLLVWLDSIAFSLGSTVTLYARLV